MAEHGGGERQVVEKTVDSETSLRLNEFHAARGNAVTAYRQAPKLSHQRSKCLLQTARGMRMAKAEVVIETVTMEDGRVVDFPGKRKILKESTVDGEGRVTVRLDFRNGAVRDYTIGSEMVAKFAAHGAEQKLGDETAGIEDLDDAVLAVEELIDRLNRGEWNVKRESGGMAGTSVLAKALAMATGKTAEEVRQFLSTKDQKEKVALRNNPRIKPFVEQIEAEKAARSKGGEVDTEALLSELG